ncbi:MAG: hypothetical protein WBA70_07570 [Thermodesulfobacteriota bacterium]
MRNFLVLNILLLLFVGFLFIPQISNSEDDISCPEKCVESRKNCDLSCSQIVGGGAKSKERRECIKSCDGDQGLCNERCLNPTPKPSLKPERYHDKPCPSSCELKAKDCNQECTKYTGGGAKSSKKAVCRQECSDGFDNCKNWCVNPTPKPTLKPNYLDDQPCPEVCKYKNFDCEASCSIYMGGGAKSGKKSKCMNECRDFNDQCLVGCKETE